MTKHIYFALSCLLLCFYSNVSAAEQAKSIKIYVTVDWEGRSLHEEDLATMQAFRKRFPHIPMLQLMNPAYFVRPHDDYALPERPMRKYFT